MSNEGNMATVIYLGQRTIVSCDRRCNKAWGWNSRPKKNPREWADCDAEPLYFTDDELNEAPTNPGTYEGGEGKPFSPDDFPNKWCVRECERCKLL